MVPAKLVKLWSEKSEVKQEEIFATLVGLKFLEKFYEAQKEDWKLVAHKAKVFLKKEGIKLKEVEHLVEIE